MNGQELEDNVSRLIQNLLGQSTEIGSHIHDCVNRSKILAEFTAMYNAWTGMEKAGANRFLSCKSGLPGPGSKVVLKPENAVTIDTLMKHANRPMKGKFFFCRTIAPVFKMTGAVTIVEDIEGKKGARLSMYNVMSETRSEDLLAILPVGTFLAIINPYFKTNVDGGMSVRVDSPTDIIHLDKPTVCRLLGGKKWKGEIPKEFKSLYDPKKNGMGVEDKSGSTGERTFQDYHSDGNKNFVEKRFHDAVDCYTKALALDPNNLTVLCNRAAAYNSLALFRLAKSDADKVLEKDPKNVKACHRWAKAEATSNGVQAVIFLQRKIMELPKKPKNGEFTLNIVIFCSQFG